MDTALLSDRGLDWRSSAPDSAILIGRDWQKTREKGIRISLEQNNNSRFGYLLIEESDDGLLAEIDCEIPAQLPTWTGNIFNRGGKLLTLKEGWDTYDASPIFPAAIARALKIILEIATINTPIPALVPMAHGGVQVEWHISNKILEIEVQEDGSSAYYYLDRSGGVKEEDETRMGRLKEIITSLLGIEASRH